jgi:Coenzyme PQQ synthesis protein D (PqqD)
VTRQELVTVEPNLRLAPPADLLVRTTARSLLLCTQEAPDPLLLREAALTVWNAFRNGATPSAVASEMSERFGLDQNDADRDVVAIVAELCRAGALVPIG